MNNTFIEIQQLTILKPDNVEYELDISNISSIDITNDISGVGYSTHIIYRDITDIKNLMPIKGGETVKLIAIQKDSTKFIKNFTVVKCDTIAEDNQANIIKISLISEDSFKLTYMRDYSFYDDISTNIIKKYIPSIVGQSSNKISIVIPGYSHTKAIQYICSKDDGLVFENKDNFKYSTLEDMMVKSDINIVFKSNNMYNSRLILDYNELSNFNALSEATSNIYKNTNKAYNPKTKSFDVFNQSIVETQKNKKTFGSGENYSTNINSNISSRINMVNLDELSMTKYDSLFNKSYEVMLQGDFNYEIGKSVNVDFTDRLSEDPSRSLSGLWLITKTTHYMNDKQFLTKLTIVKNAYTKGNVTTNVV